MDYDLYCSEGKFSCYCRGTPNAVVGDQPVAVFDANMEGSVVQLMFYYVFHFPQSLVLQMNIVFHFTIL